jgi:hypothetical protein
MADGPTSPGGGGGSHESGSPRGGGGGVREQDRFLPIANISRIMKKAIPANGKIAKDAKETVQECVSEFISFITSEWVPGTWAELARCCSFGLEFSFPWTFAWFWIWSGILGDFSLAGAFGLTCHRFWLAERVTSVRGKSGRPSTATTCSGRWPRWDSRITSSLSRCTSRNTERCVLMVLFG